MTTIRTSATVLESFRLYRDTEWLTEDRLIASIRGEVTPTPAMRVGRAYHQVLERPDRFRVPHGYQCDGYTFDDATLDPMLRLVDRRGVSEVKTTIEVDGCTLVAQADHLVGTAIHEYKTTEYFDADKYVDSYQWRVMALVFQPTVIHYHVASLDDHGNGVVTLKGPIESVRVYPYPDLATDVRALLRQFVQFVRLKGLEAFLRERQALAEAVA